MEGENLFQLSLELDQSGLVWCPEIGDEVSERNNPGKTAILVDPQGLSPNELREYFLWLPNTEQLVTQFEARQAIIYHAGVNQKLLYEAVVRSRYGVIEALGESLRLALGKALHALLLKNVSEAVH
jgi:hypothetical protein